MSYGFGTRLSGTIEEHEPRVRAALADQGFGVLTEIDVAATLKTKLDLDRAPYKILGACNPTLAAQALEKDPDIGLMLPCNVILYADGDETVVNFVDPHAMLGVADLPGMDALADEAGSLLRKALAALGE